MGAYIIRRIIQTIPLLIGITIVSFAVMHLAPGGPIGMATQMNPNIKAEDLEKMKEAMGLNEPVYIQYLTWLGDLVRGDFGYSFVKRVPVSELIIERLPNTFLLMFTSFILAFIISIPLGVISARKKNSLTDYSVTGFSFLGISVPHFWLGLMAIMFFAVKLGWFPAGGAATLDGPFSIGDRLIHLLMPALVLATGDMAGLTRYTRSSMLEVLGQDFMRTARAKGLKEKKVIYKHGLRNGLIPVITILGLILPSFFGGAVITESIFGWPGIGKLFIDSVFQRDYTMIMALTTVSAVLVVLGNLLADITYAIVDPRISYK